MKGSKTSGWGRVWLGLCTTTGMLLMPIAALSDTRDFVLMICCEWQYGTAETKDLMLEALGEGMPRWEVEAICARAARARIPTDEECRKVRQAGKTLWHAQVEDREKWPRLDASAVQVTDLQVGLDTSPTGEPLAITVAFAIQPTRDGTVDLTPSVFLSFVKWGWDGEWMHVLGASLQPPAEPGRQQRSADKGLSSIRVKGQQQYHAAVKLSPEFVRPSMSPSALCLDLDWLDQRVKRRQAAQPGHPSHVLEHPRPAGAVPSGAPQKH